MTQTSGDLHYLTIRQTGDLLREKKLSPVELTRAFLDRIESLDGTLQAYITVLADSSMAEARQAESEIHGVTIAGPFTAYPSP